MVQRATGARLAQWPVRWGVIQPKQGVLPRDNLRATLRVLLIVDLALILHTSTSKMREKGKRVDRIVPPGEYEMRLAAAAATIAWLSECPLDSISSIPLTT